jgi:ATP-dependent Clp protease ATP-binding subunit ClpB
MEKHSVSRLVGAPPGYVGYEEGGYLTEAVRRRPYSVILLDEVEKAHPDVFNILLQVLDDGRLTDSKGVTVNFAHTLIVMTSNVAAHEIASFTLGKTEGEIAAGWPELTGLVLRQLKEHFRPEFLNRIDELIVFHSLTHSQVREIARLQLGGPTERLAAQGITLDVTDSALDFLADEGYDPSFGARPMRRAIAKLVVNPIASRVISGEFKSGDVVVDDGSEEDGGAVWIGKG